MLKDNFKILKVWLIVILMFPVFAYADYTALENLTAVTDYAKQIASDVKLILVFTPADVSLEGKVGHWSYFFKSESKQWLYEIWYNDGTISRNKPITKFEDKQLNLNIQHLPETLLDSDQILNIAEANGGSDFRASHGNKYAIDMCLYPSAIGTKAVGLKLYKEPVWIASYRADDNYFNPVINAVTGELININETTADSMYQDIYSIVRNIASDAQLVNIEGNGLDLTGQTSRWNYQFKSINQNQAYQLEVDRGRINMACMIQEPENSELLTQPAIDETWYDSDIALAISEEEWGRDFRKNHPNWDINAYLLNDENTGSAVWNLCYNSPGGSDCQRISMEPRYSYARDSLSIVLFKAEQLYSGSQLLYIQTDNINTDGASNEWKYILRDSDQQTLHEYRVLNGYIFPYKLSVTDSNLQTGLTSLPSTSWLNSEIALKHADEKGGNNFRTQYPDCKIKASLYIPPGQSNYVTQSQHAIWTFDYSYAQNKLTVTVDAEDFTGLWTTQSLGSESRLDGVDAVSDQVCWVCGRNSTILLTTDGGTTWKDVSNLSGDINLSSIDGLDEQIAIVIGQDNESGLPQIYRTDNGGTSWSIVHSLEVGSLYNIHMFSQSRGLATGDPLDGEWLFLETTDGGLTWQRKHLNLMRQQYNEAGLSNSFFWLNNSVCWMGTTINGTYYTSDSGENWQFVSIPDLFQVYKIACNFDSTVLASSGYYPDFYRSTNNGQTWQQITPPDTLRISRISYSNGYFWLFIKNSIYKSKDGLSWTFSGHTPALIFQTSHFQSVDKVYTWAVGANGTVLHYMEDYISTAIKTKQTRFITNFELLQNYPNPFNPETRIQFKIPYADHISLRIYDILGREIITLLNTRVQSGIFNITWDCKDKNGKFVSSGIYLYELKTSTFNQIKRMALVR